MSSDFIKLVCDDLCVELCVPGTYYQGTRFDWSGVFRRVTFVGETFCDEWFDSPDPFRHDNVCGPSEEFFGTVGYEQAPVGSAFLKVGVGLLLRENDGPYDWFHRYPLADGGERMLEASSSSAVFGQILDGWYSYSKTVEALPGGHFRIVHSLRNLGFSALELRQYCHNFFTFGLDRVGVERSVEFDAPVSGIWREDSVNASMSGSRVWMTAPMNPGQKAYVGGLQCDSVEGYGFTLRAGSKSVRVRCSLPMDGGSVLWSNHRVFCPEPYVRLNIAPGETKEWTLDYYLQK